MSLQTTLEFCVLFERFRNIDLFQQGLYSIQVKLYTNTSRRRFASIKAFKSDLLGPIQHNLNEAQTVGKHAFITHSFYVRYVNETVELSEFVKLKLHMSLQKLEKVQFCIQFDLQYFDIGSQLQIDELQKSAAEQINWQILSSSKFTFNCPMQGICEFLPVAFDQNFSSVCNTVLIGAIVGIQQIGEFDQQQSSRQIYNLLYNQSQNLIQTFQKFKTYRKYFLSNCITLRQKESIFIDIKSPNLRLPGSQIQRPLSFQQSRHTQIIEKEQKSLNEMLQSIETIKWRSFFSESLDQNKPILVQNGMILELQSLYQQLIVMWNQLIDITSLGIRRVIQELRKIYHEKEAQCYKKLFLIRNYLQTDLTDCETNLRQLHSKTALELRKILRIKYLPLSPLKQESIPVVFEEHYQFEDSSRTNIAGQHLIILVHGYQGSGNDMRMIKNILSLYYPGSIFFISEILNGNTHSSLQELGQLLASEVKDLINSSYPIISRLSFIGYSLGGLIIRAALEYLPEFYDKLHFYCSISTPHLGFAQQKSKLVQLGIWILRQIRNEKSIEQLMFRDGPEPYLKQLPEDNKLKHFQYVVFLFSHQDKYVDINSARVTIPHEPEMQGLQQIAHKLLQDLKNWYRLDVQFDLGGRSLDNIIGRSAHIEFLENSTLYRLLALRYPMFFY